MSSSYRSLKLPSSASSPDSRIVAKQPLLIRDESTGCMRVYVLVKELSLPLLGRHVEGIRLRMASYACYANLRFPAV
jgi:hypothetical protein